MNISQKTGQAVRAIRIIKDMNQEQLKNACKIIRPGFQGDIQRIEQGRGVHLEHLEVIAKALDFELWELIGVAESITQAQMPGKKVRTCWKKPK